LGGRSISTQNGESYRDWLQHTHEGMQGGADLVSHFFRRSYALLREGGALGLIASNTIAQGDTRNSGLKHILKNGGIIYRAIRRTKWPGEAAVVVSIVHIGRHLLKVPAPQLDGDPVTRISAFLVEGQNDNDPSRLTENSNKAFQGSILLGMGFTFDDKAAEKGIAENLAEMKRLVHNNPRNAERIKPYLGGEEINNEPQQRPHRYVIDFDNFPLRRDASLPTWARIPQSRKEELITRGVVPNDYPMSVAADWPDLVSIVEKKVKPERLKSKNKDVREYSWWRHWRIRSELREAISNLDHVLVLSRVSPYLCLGYSNPTTTFADSCVVFAFQERKAFALLQSRAHEIWARFFASSMKDDLRYTPSDCFETFPFPRGLGALAELEMGGGTYHDHRAALMVARNEGMTKTYNRFHDPNNSDDDIQRLRELHAAMDRAVLEAYGWHDLAARAESRFLNETSEDDHTYQGRLFWPSDFRDEVLARLLALNAARYAEEVRLGTAPGKRGRAVPDEEEAEHE